MIDWLTLKLDPDRIPAAVRESLSGLNGRLLAIGPDGELKWQTPMRECVRSDSHQIVVTMGYTLDVCGSPARVLYDTNVFGKGDPVECAMDMLRFVERTCSVSLPDVRQWRCTRWDITHNYDLGSAAEVRQALSYLRLSEGGHLQVRTASESVYWGAGSRLRSGKAYHKGPHLRYQQRRGQASDMINAQDVALCDRLLRLEMSHRSQWFRERAGKAWHEFDETDLDRLHSEYFGQVIGKIEVTEMDSLLERFEQVAATKGQALAAYRTWALVKSIGVREAQASMPKRTFYHHKRIMFDAGLTWADFHAGNVVPLKRRTIELGEPVRSWEELRRAA